MSQVLLNEDRTNSRIRPQVVTFLTPVLRTAPLLGPNTGPERVTVTPLAPNCSNISDFLEEAEPPATAVEEVANKLEGFSEVAEIRV